LRLFSTKLDLSRFDLNVFEDLLRSIDADVFLHALEAGGGIDLAYFETSLIEQQIHTDDIHIADFGNSQAQSFGMKSGNLTSSPSTRTDLGSVLLKMTSTSSAG